MENGDKVHNVRKDNTNSPLKATSPVKDERFSLIRRSLRLGGHETPKSKDKRGKEADPVSPTKDPNEDKEVGQIPKATTAKDSGTVMEIHELIRENMLSKAFQHLRLLEKEIPTAGSTDVNETASTEIMRKWKDVQLLYHNFTEQIQSIVTDSLNSSETNAELFHSMMDIIEEEENIHSVNEETEYASTYEFLVKPQKWKCLWEKTIQKNIQQRIQKYIILQEERTESQLAVNLGYLRKQVVTDISTVKNNLQKCYPEKYRILDMYVKHFHEIISSNLRELLEKQMEYNELYAVLDWAVNTYPSEEVLRHEDLQPDVNVENLGQLLDQTTMDKLKNDYCEAVQRKIRKWMDNLIKLEQNKWSSENSPEILNNYYHSPLHIDVQMMIGQHMKNAEKIDNHLRNKLCIICMEEAKHFVSRIPNIVEDWAMNDVAGQNISRLLGHLLAIINSFQDLKSGLTQLDNLHLTNHEEMERAVDDALESFNKLILSQFKVKTQIHFEKLMTRLWISDSEGFEEIMTVINELSLHIKKMKQPAKSNLVQLIHYHIVKEYIVQVMKKKKSYKKSITCEKAAKRILEQSDAIKEIFNGLGSTAEWLNNAVIYISNIIGQNDKKMIQEKVITLNEEYPDVSAEHISAILHYRRALSNKTKRKILKHFEKLPKKDMPKNRMLFSEINVHSTAACLPYV
ncbi:exocyst complex component 3-like protein 4 isoform X2 [Protopterus annectens]|uniref:exocyst complex component 3-like protein 4 isoform X2 n=1 Tax=Protopterus annectens TaxID=7888 RepID=UPI001CFADCEA|nr:exocyst complex component 3-like protein 4 isoform X2 [Protopterus annectens]